MDAGASPLVGTWMYQYSSTVAYGATFTATGVYVAQTLLLTSDTTADDGIEKGTYTVAGNTIMLTPQESTCPGADPVYSVSFSFSGSDLILGTSSGEVIYQPDTSTASSGISITDGCFDTSGDFTASPLAPVSN